METGFTTLPLFVCSHKLFVFIDAQSHLCPEVTHWKKKSVCKQLSSSFGKLSSTLHSGVINSLFTETAA